MSKTSNAAAGHRKFKREVMEFVTPQGMPKGHDAIEKVVDLTMATSNRPSQNWAARSLKDWRPRMTHVQSSKVYRTLAGNRIQRAEAVA